MNDYVQNYTPANHHAEYLKTFPARLNAMEEAMEKILALERNSRVSNLGFTDEMRLPKYRNSYVDLLQTVVKLTFEKISAGTVSQYEKQKTLKALLERIDKMKKLNCSFVKHSDDVFATRLNYVAQMICNYAEENVILINAAQKQMNIAQR